MDVVVVAEELVTILGQQRKGIVGVEVLAEDRLEDPSFCRWHLGGNLSSATYERCSKPKYDSFLLTQVFRISLRSTYATAVLSLAQKV